MDSGKFLGNGPIVTLSQPVLNTSPLSRTVDHSRKYHHIPQHSLFGYTNKEHYGMLWYFWSGQWS